MELIPAMMTNYALQFPVWLAWLAGLIVAVRFWRQHPRVSLVTVIALVLLLVLSVISTFVSLWLPLTLVKQGVASTMVGTILGSINFVIRLLEGVAWGLILIAIFGWRQQQ